jgi:hypothetical protein
LAKAVARRNEIVVEGLALSRIFWGGERKGRERRSLTGIVDGWIREKEDRAMTDLVWKSGEAGSGVDGSGERDEVKPERGGP